MVASKIGSPRKVLVIEDETSMMALITLILKQHGYIVQSAVNGVEGLAEVKKDRPDLILLDLMMPGMSGWDVYKVLKSDDHSRDIPVIVVTAKSQNIDRVLGLHIAKVQNYITKPFSPSELIRAIENTSPMSVPIYLESGSTRTFAAALEWPGWCRSGHGEQAALQELYRYSKRYAAVMHNGGLTFQPPQDIGGLTIVERLPGTPITDSGVPGEVRPADTQRIDAGDLARFEMVLRACWLAFDTAIEHAARRKLRKGPQADERDLRDIILHIFAEHQTYLSRFGVSFERDSSASLDVEFARIRAAMIDGLTASARRDIDPEAPRGGPHWPARYFVRRMAWHVLDHVWEIEDRMQ